MITCEKSPDYVWFKLYFLAYKSYLYINGNKIFLTKILMGKLVNRSFNNQFSDCFKILSYFAGFWCQGLPNSWTPWRGHPQLPQHSPVSDLPAYPSPTPPVSTKNKSLYMYTKLNLAFYCSSCTTLTIDKINWIYQYTACISECSHQKEFLM